MRRIWILSGALLAAWAAGPSHAAVDLLQRLTEKGILTEQEKQELQKEQDVKSSHKTGSFSWMTADERFRLELYGYGQVRYTFDDKDDKVNNSNFSVQRARLGARGYAFTKDLKYQLFLNIYSGDQQDVQLFDYFLDYTPFPEFGVMAGQYKVPYAVQWNISAASLQFVERTTVDGNFRFDRDTGVNVHGKLFSMLSYDVGVYNGEGTNKNNPNDKHLWVGRLMLEPLGKYPFHESDNGISKKPLLLLVAGAGFDDDVASHTRSNLNGRLASTALGKSDVMQYDGFLGFKWMGASVHSEYYWRKIDPTNDAKKEETAIGFYAQGGYFLWQDKVEAAVRYEFFDPNDDVSENLRQEYGVGLNYFFAAHRNKVQADFFRVNTQQGNTDSTDDNRFRVQYTLAF